MLKAGIALGIAVVAMVASIAYYASGSPERTSEASPDVEQTVPEGYVRGFDPADPNVSDAQLAALEDGYVTDSEYEAAVHANVACLKEQGLRMKLEPTWDASGVELEYEVWSSRDRETSRDVRDTMLDCYRNHQWGVEQVRDRQLMPSEETLADARAALAACLVDAGVPEASIDQANLADSRIDQFEAFAGCSDEISAEFGIPNFGG